MTRLSPDSFFYTPRKFSRRALLSEFACGFGYLAFCGLNALSVGADSTTTRYVNPLAPKTPPLTPKAKRVIFLFMHGGVSHVDTFDPKPKLTEFDGQPLPGAKPAVTFAETGDLLKSPWSFRRYGKSGIEVSDLFPQVGSCIDDICVIRSMHADFVSHGGAGLQLQTGDGISIRPSMGSWLLYGLGTENQNLPGFITISPPFYHGGAQNYGSAFLPAAYQGTRLGDINTPASQAKIDNLQAADVEQRLQLDLLQTRNRQHLLTTGNDTRLEARIESYELAFRMQTEVPKVVDISRETKQTLALYGIGEEPTDDFGRQCLMARQFAEKGVRFIQVSHTHWDQHSDLYKGHQSNAAKADKPIAGLLKDLKQRGLLDSTLVIWGGEFGRTPMIEDRKPIEQGSVGRDHHPFGFTMWMAGGGVKGGQVLGKTDDLGFHVVEDKIHVHDLHATILHCLGLNHEHLTFRHQGRNFRLTDVAGQVVHKLLA